MYPLIFEPALMEKVWGGDRLGAFGKAVAPGSRIGESWEVADLAATSASGAGGQGVRSVIVNGPLASSTLHNVLSQWGDAMLGDARRAADGGFPLLVKFLDARENLSVQVHPSPAFAAAHPEAKLKTECWYVLEAAPGSMIYKGVRRGVTRETFAAAIRDGTVIDLIEQVPAIAGQCHNLPSGTVHALGAGVLVAEVQTPSDTTFRVHDWGRSGRALHIEESLDCIDYAPAPAAVDVRAGGVLRTDFFQVCSETIRAGLERPLGLERDGHGRCAILMMLRGSATLVGTGPEPTPLRTGQTVLVPAAIARETRLRAAEDAEVLVACL